MRGPGATCHAGRGGDPRGPHVPAAAGSNGWAGVGCRVCRGRPPRTPRSGGRRFERVGWGLVVVFAAGGDSGGPHVPAAAGSNGWAGVGCHVCRGGDSGGPHVPAAAGSNGWGGGWLSCLPPGATPADPTFRRPPVRTGGPGLVVMFAAGATPADPTFRRPPVRTGGVGVGCRVCRRGRLRRTPRSGGRRFER